MTVYDLEKQAKPGMHDRGSDFAEATLTRHCRNNFMHAMEALREVADMIQYETSFESPAYKRCWELIAELENVK